MPLRKRSKGQDLNVIKSRQEELTKKILRDFRTAL